MSSIDLVILGMILERPLSAYEIQKDVEYHHFSRWTKISTPSIYKKVLQLKKQGYLDSESRKDSNFAEKSVYSITEKGKAYFEELMSNYAGKPVAVQFDFNVVIANLNKLEKGKALELVKNLRKNLIEAKKSNEVYSRQYQEIPFTGKTILKQQGMLYDALLDWFDDFEKTFSSQS